MTPLGAQDTGGRDQVAQRGEVKRLRILRVKHFQAATGDELATVVAAWFRARKETTYTPEGDFVGEKDLSEQRELVDWRYQVTGSGSVTTTEAESTEGEVHHIMLFYAE